MTSDALVCEPGSAEAGTVAGFRPGTWAVLVLVLFRVVYHLTYLAEVPFAVATFSDGRLYELAAQDLLAHWPLGTAPFYLQGLYAYFLAVPMAFGGLALALLVQLALAGLALFGFHRALRWMFGQRVATWGLVLALAHPPLAFYENKFLSAELAVAASIAVILAFAWHERAGSKSALMTTGIAVGLAVLARPNLALLVLPVGWALVLAGRRFRRRGLTTWAVYTVGIVLALAPMAWRNYEVTGSATVFPAHGGGTSFFIGNNREARGVWNPAGVFSGDVSHEQDEFGAADPGEMGRVLYRRAVDDILADPVHWLGLEARKLWLLVGNDELSQDYDVWGERELIWWAYPVGVPFSVILALALVGAVTVGRPTDLKARARTWLIGAMVGATAATNLLFFTSAQHRLPMTVALLVWAAPGVVRLWDSLRRGTASPVLWVAVVLVAAQGFWPRTRVREPSAAHYFNLALAYERVDERTRAREAIDRAVELRGDHPVILLERVRLRRQQGNGAGAREDLRRLAQLPDVPEWVRARAQVEAELLERSAGRL